MIYHERCVIAHSSSAPPKIILPFLSPVLLLFFGVSPSPLPQSSVAPVGTSAQQATPQNVAECLCTSHQSQHHQRQRTKEGKVHRWRHTCTYGTFVDTLSIHPQEPCFVEDP